MLGVCNKQIIQNDTGIGISPVQWKSFATTANEILGILSTKKVLALE